MRARLRDVIVRQFMAGHSIGEIASYRYPITHREIEDAIRWALNRGRK